MNILKSSTRIALTLVTVLCYFVQPALSKNNTNWYNLNTTQYISEQMNCQQKIADFYWLNRDWPASNPEKKPSREAIISNKGILQDIEKNLVTEMLLQQHFNERVSANELQLELERITNSTRMPEKLKVLFNLLQNDVNSIVECLVRPYVAKDKIYQAYLNDSSIHLQSKQAAIVELTRLLNEGKKPKNQTIIKYTTDRDNNEVDDKGNQIETIKVSAQQLNQRLVDLQHKPFSMLQENDYIFFYEELIEHQESSFTVRRFYWNKVPFENWFKYEKNNLSQTTYRPINLKLKSVPKINYNKGISISSGNPVFTDTWKMEFMPYARFNHVAVWTGSEMIIWGGYGQQQQNSGGRYDPVTNHWQDIPPLDIAINNTFTGQWHGTWSGNEMFFWAGNEIGGRYNPSTNSWINMNMNTPFYFPENPHVHWTGNDYIIWGGVKSNSSYSLKGAKYNPISDTWTLMPLLDAPTDRSGTTSVWTGNSLLVWGGLADNNGWRYHNDTNTWSIISNINAPFARRNHTATWVEDGMVIWGGYKFEQGFVNLSDGAHYNPDSDIWTPLETNGAPTERESHSAIFTGNKLIIWGGNQITGNSNDGSIYDLNTGNWSALTQTSAPAARAYHSAVWTGEEMIIWGGSSNSTSLSSGARYSLSNTSWIAIKDHADFFSDNRSASKIWTGNELILWGGVSSGKEFNTGAKYLPIIDHWESTSMNTAPSHRYKNTAIWTGLEMIVWGGHDGGNGYLSDGGKYNPATDNWTETLCCTSAVPRGRTNHSAVWSGTEMIVWGGFYVDALGQGFGLKTGSRYNPLTNTWTPIDTSLLPYNRSNHSAFWTGSRMLVWGGTNYVNSGYIYNPNNDSWQTTTSLNAPDIRVLYSAIWTGDEMIIWGGQDNVNATQWFNNGSRYNPDTDIWQDIDISNAPTGRGLHSAVWTGQDMIIWGGNDDFESLQSGGIYNPDTNSWVATSLFNAPPARDSHIASWLGNQMIIWGGSDLETEGASAYTGYYTPYRSDLIFENDFE